MTCHSWGHVHCALLALTEFCPGDRAASGKVLPLRTLPERGPEGPPSGLHGPAPGRKGDPVGSCVSRLLSGPSPACQSSLWPRPAPLSLFRADCGRASQLALTWVLCWPCCHRVAGARGAQVTGSECGSCEEPWPREGVFGPLGGHCRPGPGWGAVECPPGLPVHQRLSTGLLPTAKHAGLEASWQELVLSINCPGTWWLEVVGSADVLQGAGGSTASWKLLRPCSQPRPAVTWAWGVSWQGRAGTTWCPGRGWVPSRGPLCLEGLKS